MSYALLKAVLLAPSAQAASFSASLEPDTVVVGDAAALKLVFEGSGELQLSPPKNIPGLVISGPTQSRSVNIVNGQRTESVTVIYYVRPTQTNVFDIPPLVARIGDEEFRSPPLRLRAVRATQGVAAQALAALRLVVPKQRFYVGESVVVELQLILQGNASNPTSFEMPDLFGEEWLTGQPVQSNARQTRYGGRTVTIYSIRIPATPLQPGELSLGPTESSVVVQVPAQRRREDPFGGFAFDLFRRTEPRRVALSLPAHPVQILPLPTENVPSSFSGAIGQFDMSVSAGPTNLTVGDPLTVRVRISGTGNIRSVSLPPLTVDGDFKTYEPESTLDTQDELEFTGVKTVEQILIPQHTEVRELPPIEFSYFDPVAEDYRTLTHPAIPLVVMPAGTRPVPLQIANTTQSPPESPRQDIVHIKQTLDDLSTRSPRRSAVKRIYATNALPFLAWIGAVAWRRHREAVRRNPKLRRRQQVRRQLAEGLDELRHQARASDPDGFFALVFRLLQEQIGLTLDLPSSGITESVIDERLTAMGLEEHTLATLHDLFQACDAARYAPSQDRRELEELISTVEEVIRALQEVES